MKRVMHKGRALVQETSTVRLMVRQIVHKLAENLCHQPSRKMLVFVKMDRSVCFVIGLHAFARVQSPR